MSCIKVSCGSSQSLTSTISFLLFTSVASVLLLLQQWRRRVISRRRHDCENAKDGHGGVDVIEHELGGKAVLEEEEDVIEGKAEQDATALQRRRQRRRIRSTNTITIAYSSTTGTCQTLAHKLYQVLMDQPWVLGTAATHDLDSCDDTYEHVGIKTTCTATIIGTRQEGEGEEEKKTEWRNQNQYNDNTRNDISRTNFENSSSSSSSVNQRNNNKTGNNDMKSFYYQVQLVQIDQVDWWDELLNNENDDFAFFNDYNTNNNEIDKKHINHQQQQQQHLLSPILLIVLPTWSNGTFPPNAITLQEQLQEIITDWRVPPYPLRSTTGTTNNTNKEETIMKQQQQLHVSVFGMGSSEYDNNTFCKPAISAYTTLVRTMGAKPLCKLGKGDEYHCNNAGITTKNTKQNGWSTGDATTIMTTDEDAFQMWMIHGVLKGITKLLVYCKRGGGGGYVEDAVVGKGGKGPKIFRGKPRVKNIVIVNQDQNDTSCQNNNEEMDTTITNTAANNKSGATSANINRSSCECKKNKKSNSSEVEVVKENMDFACQCDDISDHNVDGNDDYDDGDDDDDDDYEGEDVVKQEPDVIDMEDIGGVMSSSDNNNNDNSKTAPKEMVSSKQAAALKKEGYKLIGTHSAVKLCRWTKHQLRGRGGCYKHTFYGITSYQCMEATPSLACANKCVFCWRHHKNPVGKEWRWKTDDPYYIVDQAVQAHVRMIREARGIPGVLPQRWNEALTVRHCALSLVGEPIMYPRIIELLGDLHNRKISTFLVTNGQHPLAIESLCPVTQLYVSVDAPTPKSLVEIDRPLFSDAWERLCQSLTCLKDKGQRTVARLTVVKGWNSNEVEGYANLIALGRCSLVEVKGVTFCGKSDASNLNMSNTPWHHEVVELTKTLQGELTKLTERGGPNAPPLYGLACEHKHSCSVLLARLDQFAVDDPITHDRQWRTWIDYEKFHQLVARRISDPSFVFDVKDYVADTPSWAIFGANEEGFDPTDARHRRRTKHPMYTKFDKRGVPTHNHNNEELDVYEKKRLGQLMDEKIAHVGGPSALIRELKGGEKSIVDPTLMFRGLVVAK